MWNNRQSNKFGARKVSFQGSMYDSQMEMEYAMILADHLKAKRLKEVERQHKIIIKVNGKVITTHIVDFLVTLPDDRKKYVEVKGFPTDLWIIKRKLVEATESIPYLVNPTDKQLFL